MSQKLKRKASKDPDELENDVLQELSTEQTPEQKAYTRLPTSFTGQENKQVPNVRSFVEQIVSSSTSNVTSTLEKKLLNKALLLENPVSSTSIDKMQQQTLKRKKNREKKTHLGRKARKEKGLTQVKPDIKSLFQNQEGKVHFEHFLPLHELWKQYVEELLQDEQALSAVENRFLKADLHGAFITVTRSLCSSFVGCSGLLIQETQDTFVIITKEHKIKRLPKNSCHFAFEITSSSLSSNSSSTKHNAKSVQQSSSSSSERSPQTVRIELYGPHLLLRASEKSVRKFKQQPSIAL